MAKSSFTFARLFPLPELPIVIPGTRIAEVPTNALPSVEWTTADLVALGQHRCDHDHLAVRRASGGAVSQASRLAAASHSSRPSIGMT